MMQAMPTTTPTAPWGRLKKITPRTTGGTISGSGFAAIAGITGPATVLNAGLIDPGTFGINLPGGGSVTNLAGGVIEGVLIACYAVGCSQAFLYVRGEMALAQERIAAALNEAYAAGYVEPIGRTTLRATSGAGGADPGTVGCLSQGTPV